MGINFKKETIVELDKMIDIVEKFPWENKKAYADFLSNHYHITSRACRLIASAASRCGMGLDVFHHRFVDHLSEEKNHEKLVLADLKYMREETADCLFSAPPIWQTQFYLIENVDPLSLFGYTLFFEYISIYEPVGPKLFQRCLKEHGNHATNYLRVHVEEDFDHVDRLNEMLEQLPIESQENVLSSLKITSNLYSNFFRELSEKHMKAQVLKKAS